MAILIVLQNSVLASEIGTILRRDGHSTKSCPSTICSEFLKSFSQAELIVTDIVPAVLSLLAVGDERILGGPKPLLLIASPGHCDSFRAMLKPGRDRCIAWEPGESLHDQIRHHVADLVAAGGGRRNLTNAESPLAKPYPAKLIAADKPHQLRVDRFARQALRRQVRFVSDIAHDLRTPLTAICEFAELMRSGVTGEMNEQQRRYIGIIERRCDEATRMVYDLLDGARLQSGRIHPHRQAIEIRDVVRDVIESLEPAIRQSGIALNLEIPDDMPRVFADRDMLGRIVANLVSNAIKFSPAESKVTVRCERSSVSMARLSVIDSGPGISAQDLRRIFRRFEQGANCTRSGVGLGLAIVRELVKLHHGRVTVESSPGKGSRFHFTLPLFLPTAIVRRYLTNAMRQPRLSTSWWRLTFHDTAQYDALHRLINATVRAHELVLPQDARRSILLGTNSRKPERLLERLQRQVVALGGAMTIDRVLSADVNRWCRDEGGQGTGGSHSAGSTPLAG